MKFGTLITCSVIAIVAAGHFASAESARAEGLGIAGVDLPAAADTPAAPANDVGLVEAPLLTETPSAIEEQVSMIVDSAPDAIETPIADLSPAVEEVAERLPGFPALIVETTRETIATAGETVPAAAPLIEAAQPVLERVAAAVEDTTQVMELIPDLPTVPAPPALPELPASPGAPGLPTTPVFEPPTTVVIAASTSAPSSPVRPVVDYPGISAVISVSSDSVAMPASANETPAIEAGRAETRFGGTSEVPPSETSGASAAGSSTGFFEIPGITALSVVNAAQDVGGTRVPLPEPPSASACFAVLALLGAGALFARPRTGEAVSPSSRACLPAVPPG